QPGVPAIPGQTNPNIPAGQNMAGQAPGMPPGMTGYPGAQGTPGTPGANNPGFPNGTIPGLPGSIPGRGGTTANAPSSSSSNNGSFLGSGSSFVGGGGSFLGGGSTTPTQPTTGGIYPGQTMPNQGLPAQPGMPVSSQTGGVSPYPTQAGANGAPPAFPQPG